MRPEAVRAPNRTMQLSPHSLGVKRSVRFAPALAIVIGIAAGSSGKPGEITRTADERFPLNETLEVRMPPTAAGGRRTELQQRAATGRIERCGSSFMVAVL